MFRVGAYVVLIGGWWRRTTPTLHTYFLHVGLVRSVRVVACISHARRRWWWSPRLDADLICAWAVWASARFSHPWGVGWRTTPTLHADFLHVCALWTGACVSCGSACWRWRRRVPTVKSFHCWLLGVGVCHEHVFLYVSWWMHGHEPVLLKPVHVKLGHSLSFGSEFHVGILSCHLVAELWESWPWRILARSVRTPR